MACFANCPGHLVWYNGVGEKICTFVRKQAEKMNDNISYSHRSSDDNCERRGAEAVGGGGGNGEAIRWIEVFGEIRWTEEIEEYEGG